jgi:hypothetical protein
MMMEIFIKKLFLIKNNKSLGENQMNVELSAETIALIINKSLSAYSIPEYIREKPSPCVNFKSTVPTPAL